ncbi:hypothetical protein LX73_2330 [Fodinibius salinus]|uniref:Uncharacterized protein n=1 Tax=Fodinibius salinus TaxID=860790 RepID=A0A5D3YGE9_9BACT|nr:hypothetical protein [Fodinibius salinus]TYP92083.1 hypothetical protein LX73_2330 [Fodinibius salinus]
MQKQKIATLGNDNVLADSNSLAGTFSPDIVSVKVVNRFPSKGLPPKGVPFSLEVQVDVDRTIGSQAREFYTGWLLTVNAARCPDVVVAARTAYTADPKVLAISDVITDITKGCVGSVKLSFPKSYRPSEKDWIQLEVYDEGTSKESIKNGNTDPLYIGEKFQPRLSYEQGVATGVYEQKTGVLGFQQGSLNPFAGAFSGVGNTVKSLTVLIAVGTGGYLLWKNGENIQEYIDDKIDAAKPSNIKKKLTK